MRSLLKQSCFQRTATTKSLNVKSSSLFDLKIVSDVYRCSGQMLTCLNLTADPCSCGLSMDMLIEREGNVWESAHKVDDQPIERTQVALDKTPAMNPNA